MMKINRVAIAFALGLLAGPALWAGGLLERDVQRLERAREQHLTEIERAFEVYANRVERANTTLARIYEPIISRYENRGDPRIAEDLKHELEVLTRTAITMPMPGEGLDSTMKEAVGGHEALIRAIGPEVVNARGQRAPTAGLERYDYAVLYFTAGWCGPCRQFTPELVRFYEQNQSAGSWEVIVVSGDRSESDFYNYLNNAGMPWAAVPYDRRETLLQAFPGGWPRIYVLDREANTVLSQRGAGPRILDNLRELLHRK